MVTNFQTCWRHGNCAGGSRSKVRQQCLITLSCSVQEVVGFRPALVGTFKIAQNWISIPLCGSERHSWGFNPKLNPTRSGAAFLGKRAIVHIWWRFSHIWSSAMKTGLAESFPQFPLRLNLCGRSLNWRGCVRIRIGFLISDKICRQRRWRRTATNSLSWPGTSRTEPAVDHFSFNPRSENGSKSSCLRRSHLIWVSGNGSNLKYLNIKSGRKEISRWSEEWCSIPRVICSVTRAQKGWSIDQFSLKISTPIKSIQLSMNWVHVRVSTGGSRIIWSLEMSYGSSFHTRRRRCGRFPKMPPCQNWSGPSTWKISWLRSFWNPYGFHAKFNTTDLVDNMAMPLRSVMFPDGRKGKKLSHHFTSTIVPFTEQRGVRNLSKEIRLRKFPGLDTPLILRPSDFHLFCMLTQKIEETR
jgi:hypothetical protein